MVNGITVKQAIENELDGKDKYTINDIVKCIKHIADGIDNLPVDQCQERLRKLEGSMRLHKRVLSAIWSVSGGVIVLGAQFIINKLKGE